MVYYYFNRLESLIERWQSRRKTIEISTPIKSSPLAKCPLASSLVAVTATEGDVKKRRKKTGSLSDFTVASAAAEEDKENERRVKVATTAMSSSSSMLYKQIGEVAAGDNISSGSSGGDQDDDEMLETMMRAANQHHHSNQRPRHSHHHQLSRSALVTCPSLIYVIIAIAISLQVATHYDQTLANPLTGRIGGDLFDQLASPDTRDRWIRVPSPSEARDPFRSPIRRGPLAQALSRLRNRIGARHSIRFHNAFRDLAWRILSSLSMPTPVIYELRRQNFYSPEEDMVNDSLFNKNTSKTIRSRRLLSDRLLSSRMPASAGKRSANALHRAGDEDDDEPETLVERLRMRLEDMVAMSHRGLFGTRVLRVPWLFPFKRQENDEESHLETTTQAGNGRRRPQTRRRRRKRKEADRQMITINGKQYFVDDDGQLKQLVEKEKSES